jgi:hypothetical protein
MIRLPPFTFLSGPPGCGKTTIATALSATDPNMSHCSIAEPIRMALLSTFHPDQMTQGLDLRDGGIKASLIPGTGITYRQWMTSFSEFMKSMCGKQIFGDLAKRSIEELTMYYDRFIFDDARFIDEIRPFANAYGGDKILIVHINRNGATWGSDLHTDLTKIIGVRHVGLNNNGTLPETLAALAAALGQDLLSQTILPSSPLPEAIEPGIDEL